MQMIQQRRLTGLHNRTMALWLSQPLLINWQTTTTRLPDSTWGNIKRLGIARNKPTHRGKRAGRRKKKDTKKQTEPETLTLIESYGSLNIVNSEEYKQLLNYSTIHQKMADEILSTSPETTKNYQSTTKQMANSKKRKLPKFKLASINLRTAEKDSHLQNYINRCSEFKLDIIAVQEVHRLNSGSVRVKSLINDETYDCYWSSTSVRNRFCGVGMFLRSARHIVMLEEPIYISPRVMTCTVAIRGYKLRIVNVYSPTEDKPMAVKQKFFKDVETAISSPFLNSQLIVLGDFNAKISALSMKSSLNHTNVDTINDLTYNDNGELLLDLICDHHLYNLNSAFSHPLIRRETRITPDKSKKNQIIDYINVSSNLRRLCTNCRVNRSIITEELSDHRILIATFRIPADPLTAKRMFPKSTQPPSQNPIKFLIKSKLQSGEVKKKYTEAIELKFTHQQSTSDLSRQLIISVSDAAIATLPSKSRSTKKLPWADDEQLLKLLKQKRSSGYSRESQEVTRLNNLIKKRLRYLENQFYMQKCKELNLLRESRQVEKEFKRAKDIATGSVFNTIKSNSMPIPELIEHFKAHFNHDQSKPPPPLPNEIRNPPKFITDLRIVGDYQSIDQEPPCAKEIIHNLNKLKDNKAAEDVPSEFLKYAQTDASVIGCLELILKKIWDGEEIPSDWGVARIEALYKNKGKRSDPTKYRGLSIGSSVGKLFCSIIVNRLDNWYNSQLSGSQFGFRRGVGTVDAILKNKQIQRLAAKTRKTVYALFIDLSAAFDRVVRAWIFESIRIRTPEHSSTKIIDLLERFYKSTSCYLRQDQEVVFSTGLGVRQGGIESPSLFCWFLDLVMRVYENRLAVNNITPPKFNYRVSTAATDRAQRSAFPARGVANTTWTGYADDTTLYASNPEDLEKCLEIIAQVYKEFHLSLNVEKTKSMIFQSVTNENEYPKSIIKFGETAVDNCESFKFLGSMVNYKEIGTGDVELNSRIQNAKAKFAEYKRLLTNYNIRLNVRTTYYNVFIRSRLTYACQTWHLTQSQFNKIDAANRKMLRKMIINGEKRLNGDDENEDNNNNYKMQIGNTRLLEICKSDNISEYIKKQQVKFAAHIVRQPNLSEIKQLLFNDDKNRKTGHLVPNLFRTAVSNLGLSDVDHFARESKKRKF